MPTRARNLGPVSEFCRTKEEAPFPLVSNYPLNEAVLGDSCVSLLDLRVRRIVRAVTFSMGRAMEMEWGFQSSWLPQ